MTVSGIIKKDHNKKNTSNIVRIARLVSLGYFSGRKTFERLVLNTRN